jgi:hypothetical protein
VGDVSERQHLDAAERRRLMDEKLAAREAELRAVPRLEVGDKVERDHLLTGRPVPGEVVAAGDDPQAGGGWVAVVRYWFEDRGRFHWEVAQADDLLEEGRKEARVRRRKMVADG